MLLFLLNDCNTRGRQGAFVTMQDVMEYMEHCHKMCMVSFPFRISTFASTTIHAHCGCSCVPMWFKQEVSEECRLSCLNLDHSYTLVANNLNTVFSCYIDTENSIIISLLHYWQKLFMRLFLRCSSDFMKELWSVVVPIETKTRRQGIILEKKTKMCWLSRQGRVGMQTKHRTNRCRVAASFNNTIIYLVRDVLSVCSVSSIKATQFHLIFLTVDLRFGV